MGLKVGALPWPIGHRHSRAPGPTRLSRGQLVPGAVLTFYPCLFDIVTPLLSLTPQLFILKNFKPLEKLNSQY